MAIFPDAKWEPVSGHNGGPLDKYLGVVLHVNDANSYDLRDFIQASSGQNIVSCHFQVGKDGAVFQYVDTAVQAWCQGHGNATYLSIESEGKATDQATPQQVASIGRILHWCHETHGIPLILAEKPGDWGFGWHGMGAANGDPLWGHALCPGVRKDQRLAMLAAATPLTDEDEDVPTLLFDKADPKRAAIIFGNTAISLSDAGTAPAFKEDGDTKTVGVPTADYNRIVGVLTPKVA